MLCRWRTRPWTVQEGWGKHLKQSQKAGSFLIWELLILGSDTYSGHHSEWQEGSKQLWEDENFSDNSNDNTYIFNLTSFDLMVWLYGGKKLYLPDIFVFILV